MNKERERRLNRLLGEALERAAEERRAFLESACEDDEGLLGEACELLAEETELGDFLERPAPTRIGKLGPYRVLDLLGEGGMGCVYLAEQTEPVHRKVALKLVRSSIASPEATARLNAERQALARLSHPNVGKMLEAGTTENGFPYFAMELVDGPPITEYCDRRELGIEDRLELFVTVCHGVQHAHQKQILHRDLKPSNVLVEELDGRAVPKIIDFGIAKSLDLPLTDLTLSTGEHTLGTPSYMSPEALRADADLDTRTDVYSLGILLYELLTGVRPFETPEDTAATVLRRIVEEAPPAPSQRLDTLAAGALTEAGRRRGLELDELRRRLRGDLDHIVLKALAKDRQERYASAAELAADVERHLRHQPVSVVPASLGYHARKLLERRRAAVLAAAAVLAVVVLGAIGTSLGMVRAMRAEQLARAEAERANHEARAAHRTMAEAEEVATFLGGRFKRASPFASEGREPRPAEAISARQLLDEGTERISAELSERPLLQAKLLTTIGEVYGELGDYEAAQPLFERALELRREALGEEHPDVAVSYTRLGQLEQDLGHFEASEDHLRRALEIQERHPGDVSELARTLNALGNLGFHRGQHEQAEGFYRRSLELSRRAEPREPERIAQGLNNLAISLASQGRLDKAAPFFEEVLALRRELLGERHPKVAESLNNLGVLYLDLERPADAEPFHRQALELRERSLGPDHPLVAWSLDNLGISLKLQGRTEEAEPLQRRALEIREGALGAEHPDVARSLFQLADLAERQGRSAEARRLFERSLEIRERAFGDDHATVGWSAQRLGALLWRGGDRERGEPLLERGLEILSTRRPEDPLYLAAVREHAELEAGSARRVAGDGRPQG